MIVYFRGGCGYFGVIDERVIERKLVRLAQEGYVVIGSNLVEQDNTYIDTIGGETCLDYLNLLGYFREYKNIHYIGASRAAVDIIPVASGADVVPASICIMNSWYNIYDFFDFRPKMKKVYEQYFNTKDIHELEKRNLFLYKPPKTHFLLCANRDDDSVKSSFTEHYCEHLLENDYSVELNVFNEGGHSHFPFEKIMRFIEKTKK